MQQQQTCRQKCMHSLLILLIVNCCMKQTSMKGTIGPGRRLIAYLLYCHYGKPCLCINTRGRVRAGPSLSFVLYRPTTRHTHSGLAAVCRYSADRQTDTRQTRLTNQPTGQQPFCQYPAVSWEFITMLHQLGATTLVTGRQ